MVWSAAEKVMAGVLVALQITIAYPDEGAWKRFHYQFKKEGFPEVGGTVHSIN
jgi:hypothetical protein